MDDFKNEKARAWYLAASILRHHTGSIILDPKMRDHVLNVVVESLIQRARIIERRKSRTA